MALIDDTHAGAQSRTAAAVRAFDPGLSLFIVFAACISFVLFGATFMPVWKTGAFFDTDDAMRFVQVQALLHGQSWFDMTAYDMDPPAGVFMHWSRVVDVPLVLLIKTFGLFTDPVTAGRLARLAFPFALLLALYVGMARLANVLIGPAARIPAIAAAVLSPGSIAQFQPGRIDHHAPQIVCLVFCVSAALAALERRRAHEAAVAGVLLGLSLAISLENLPFLALLSGAMVAVWVWYGASVAAMLTWFAGGLALGLPFFFLGTIAPNHWLAPVCDAFGAAHLGAGLIGATGCVATALASARLPMRKQRLAVAAGVALVAGAFVALAYPACLHDPFAGVDPLVRAIWIANVQESYPFLRLWRERPVDAACFMIPLALGLVASLIVAWRTRGTQRPRFMIMAGLSAIGIAMGFWQVRVFASVTPLALFGGVAVAVAARQHCLATHREVAASLSHLVIAPFTALIWMAGSAFLTPPNAAEAQSSGDNTCLAPSAYAPIAALPKGRVLAPIDAGPFLLVHTGMSVYAAPYHRNNDGNLFEVETFLGPPETAAARLKARGAAYLMVCPGFHELGRLADRAPDGLAAALRAGRVPPGLTPVPLAGSPYTVFKLASP